MCAVFALNAQNKGKWQVGAVLSPSYSRIYYNDKQSNEYFYMKPFLSGGLQVRYFIIEGLAIRTGLVYLNNGSGLNLIDFRNDPEGMLGPSEKGVNRVKSIGIPVGLDFFLANNEKIGFTLGLDIMNAYTFKDESESYFLPKDNQNRLIEREPFMEYFLAINPNLGMEINLNESIIFSASPTFSYQVMTRKPKFSDGRFRQIGFGLDVGLYFDL